MKVSLLVALPLFTITTYGQDVTIWSRDGQVTTTKVSAISDTQLYTNSGNFRYSEIDSLYSSDQDFLAKVTRKMAVAFDSKSIPQFTSLHPDYIDSMPFDEVGRLKYFEVTEEKGMKNDLYLRSKMFFTEAFKSANDVIQLDDKETATVVGKGFNKISLPSELGLGLMTPMMMYYTVKIQCKDNRYRYEIYDIYFKNYPGPYVTSSEIIAETYFLKSEYYRKNGEAKTKNLGYKTSLEKTVFTLILSVKDRMSKSIQSKDDW
jgi:hypothetical protein